MSTVDSELNNLGKKIVSDAKSTVPVRTGNLRTSIKYESQFISNEKFNLIITELLYGKFVDEGTVKQKAQPYMTNAINKNLDNSIKSIIDIIVNDITKDILNPE